MIMCWLYHLFLPAGRFKKLLLLSCKSAIQYHPDLKQGLKNAGNT
jgi:hypothetical protein